MNKTFKKSRIWVVISIIYTILLFLFVIVKIYSPQGSIWFTRNLILQNRAKGYWNINLIPFKSIKSYFDFTYGINYRNILANTIPFILLGGVFSLAQGENFKLSKVLLICFGSIIFFEIFQLVSCFGSFDVDDIIMNFISCMIGTFLFIFYTKVNNHTQKEG